MGPDFAHEDRVAGRVCGIDEAGRGPLAGPVTAAAVLLPRRLPELLRRHLDDSKTLGAARRQQLAVALQDCAEIGVGWAGVGEIDEINILQATFLAMGRAAAQISCDHALVDGNRPPRLRVPVTCIVRGDSLSLSIAAASIIAKTARDTEMLRLADLHPGYGWEHNAGYGTAEHMAAIGRLGVTPHHRRSFAPVRAALTAAG